MKRRYSILTSFILFGLMSCSNFHSLDNEIEAVNRYSSEKRYVRGSLNKAVKPDPGSVNIVRIPDEQAPEVPEIVLRDTPEVRKYLGLYTGRYRKDVEEPLRRRAEYLPTIEKVLNYFELPLELSNLAFVESKFDVNVRSPQGATGLWQFMKPTAELLGLRCHFWNDERKDVLRSTIAAAKYIKELHNKYDDWLLTLAAYNAGPGRVSNAIDAAGGEKDFYKIARMNLLPRETVNHVSKFIALSMITRNPDVYNFNELIQEERIGDFSAYE